MLKGFKNGSFLSEKILQCPKKCNFVLGSLGAV